MSLKNILNNWWDRLQLTFAKVNWSKVFPFFLFLILAFIFWMFLFFERKTDASHRIPLKYTNLPEDEVFINNTPNHIDVRVRDLGKELFRYMFRKRDSLQIDVTEAQRNNATKLQGNELTQLIHTKLYPSTDIVGYLPASIPIETTKLYSKVVPIFFDGEILTSDSHLAIDSIAIIPNEVKILGSKEKLDKISEISTEYTVFEDLTATSQLPARLKRMDGVKEMDPTVVDIYIPILEYTERQFEVPIHSKNSPKTMDVKFFPSRAKVTFSVTLDDYKKINPEDFEIVLDYNELRQIEDDQVELKLTKHPSSIRNPKLTPSTVEFLFEYK